MFQLEILGIDKFTRKLDPMLIKKAGKSTINKVMVTARKESNKAVRAKFNVKAGRISKSSVFLIKARDNKLEGVLIAKGRRVGLINFGAKQLARSFVKVKVIKRGGFKKIPRAFIATVKGNTGVHIRTSPKSKPVKFFRKGPSIPHMFISAKADKVINTVARFRFEPIFKKQYKFFFNKAR